MVNRVIFMAGEISGNGGCGGGWTGGCRGGRRWALSARAGHAIGVVPGLDEGDGLTGHVGRAVAGAVEGRAQAEAAGACRRIGRDAFRRDAADGCQRHAGRDHCAPGLEHGGGKRLRREELEQVGAGGQRGIGFGQRRHAGRAGQAGRARGADHGGVAVGHDDDLPTGLGHVVAVLRGKHRACTDHAVGGEGIAQCADAGQGLGGVERHFDDAEARVVQGVADRHGLMGLDAAQDGDEAAALQGVEQGVVDGGHAARLSADEDWGAPPAGRPAARAICQSPVGVAWATMAGSVKPCSRRARA